MHLLHLLLCSASVVFSLRSPSLATPVRVTKTAGPRNQSQHHAYPIRFRNELNSVQVEVTTYAPRPTTSMPQSQLRSLCESPRGKFQHPLDCRKYVDCWDGRVLEKRCPNDLVFSDLPGEFCDYLEYVDCGSRPVLEEQVDTSQQQPIASTTAAPDIPPFFKWISLSTDQELPKYAVVAGGLNTDKAEDIIYVGRALIDGHVIPCTLIPTEGCYSYWNDNTRIHHQYEVLQSNAAKWISGMSSESSIPNNAIPTGFLDLDPIPQRMYSGRAAIANSYIIPGYIYEGNKILTQTLRGAIYFSDEYDILVLNK